MNKSNGDTNRIWYVETGDPEDPNQAVRGLGSYHKTLPHNEFGEVDPAAFAALVSATRGEGSEFSQVPTGPARKVTTKDKKGKETEGYSTTAQFTNPQAGLATDKLVHPPSDYAIPPAPGVNSATTAAEMVELYWMALLRDKPLSLFSNPSPTGDGGGEPKCDPGSDEHIADAVGDINDSFGKATSANFLTDKSNATKAGKFKENKAYSDGIQDQFILGRDIPGSATNFKKFTQQSLFRLGLPGEDVGPMLSQFFLRPVGYGTQSIDPRQRPYATGRNYLTDFADWLDAQNTGKDRNNQSYSQSNEYDDTFFGGHDRYICTMRDLARFVNKDALHQAYFNAALILLSGGARWPLGNPYYDLGKDNDVVKGELPSREAGFGVLGGPHILALVSEVATRALKVVWSQKWQTHLRLRPEAYGGLLHVQELGVGGKKRGYGLPGWLAGTAAAKKLKDMQPKTLLLPMAYSAGSPTHPAYGAGHATVAGACVTVLKAYFLTFATNPDGKDEPVAFCTLSERPDPLAPRARSRRTSPASRSRGPSPWIAIRKSSTTARRWTTKPPRSLPSKASSISWRRMSPWAAPWAGCIGAPTTPEASR